VAGKRSPVVIKIGSSSLVEATTHRLRSGNIESLTRQIAALVQAGRPTVLVSSGAVAVGTPRLRLPARALTIPEKQAAAAIGQGMLMQEYEKAFSRMGLTTAQVLLTRDVMGDRRRYIHARNTLTTLLEHDVVPVVNENDTVAVDEIRFGDNDTLSAHVAGLVGADMLILLTDIDGLYTADPRVDPEARRIDWIDNLSERYARMAGRSGSRVGTGGMKSKIQAAMIATRLGIPVVIAKADRPNVILDALAGEPVGTRIAAAGRMPGKKRWIAFSSAAKGAVVVDRGAVSALVDKGRSLLASGIVQVTGAFGAGDVVLIRDQAGTEIGRGVVNYDADDLRLIQGMKSEDIVSLGISSRKVEVIHRDDMVVYENAGARGGK
jgi:glutamate 5-kinase